MNGLLARTNGSLARNICLPVLNKLKVLLLACERHIVIGQFSILKDKTNFTHLNLFLIFMTSCANDGH